MKRGSLQYEPGRNQVDIRDIMRLSIARVEHARAHLERATEYPTEMGFPLVLHIQLCHAR
jgi:hypothetical protein